MSKNQTISLNKQQLEVMHTLCGNGKKYPSKYAFCKEAIVQKLEKEEEGEKKNERVREGSIEPIKNDSEPDKTDTANKRRIF